MCVNLLHPLPAQTPSSTSAFTSPNNQKSVTKSVFHTNRQQNLFPPLRQLCLNLDYWNPSHLHMPRINSSSRPALSSHIFVFPYDSLFSLTVISNVHSTQSHASRIYTPHHPLSITYSIFFVKFPSYRGILGTKHVDSAHKRATSRLRINSRTLLTNSELTYFIRLQITNHWSFFGKNNTINIRTNCTYKISTSPIRNYLSWIPVLEIRWLENFISAKYKSLSK